MLVLMHLIALPFPFILWETPAIPQIDILAGVTAGGLGLLIMMVPAALIGTVKLIYSRGDMDLLLSSPIEPRSIVVVRVLTIALGLFALAGIFTLPFANLMAAFGYPRFLLGYIALLSMTLFATALGMLIAQGLFALLGARHTRLVAQIVAGLVGLAFLLLINLHNILSDGTQTAALEKVSNLADYVPAADSWIWLPARAAIGEPMPFLIAVILCAGLFVLTTLGLANRLIDNAIAANGTASKTVKERGRNWLPLRGGTASVMRRKEWLLIARDPWLMTQIAQQILFCLPCIFLLWKASSAAVAWLAVIFISGQLAGSLAWLTVSTEEAPDLLATSPVRRANVLIAKLHAALVPAAMLASVPVAVAWTMNAWLGFTLLLCCAGSALSCALLHMRYPSTAKRSEMAWRGNSNQILGLVEMLIALAWVLAGFLMLQFGWWGMLAIAILSLLAGLLTVQRR
jgi:ABC-2 type transport system permease protein